MEGPRARENYGGYGSERQDEIFLRGLSGQKSEIPLALADLEAAAKAKLPPAVFDYIRGGAGEEETLLANREAFRRRAIVPRVLTDVSHRDTRVELFGKTLPAPFLFTAAGLLELAHPDGALAVARAATTLGLPLVLSTRSSHTIEDTAKQMENANRWFQLYHGREWSLSSSLIGRAEECGYSALVVTLDVQIRGWRKLDLQHADSTLLRGGGNANYVADPVFQKKFGVPSEDGGVKVRPNTWTAADSGVDLRTLKMIRDRTRLPLVLKGILSPSDAKLAIDCGVDGIIVSNHGGRQLDGAVASLDALPDVVKEVDGRVPVLIDSGIRSGADAFKAIALGARAVLVGRPYVWGLAVGGEMGVKEVMQNLLAEFDVTMALSGTANVKEITRDFIKEQ